MCRPLISSQSTMIVGFVGVDHIEGPRESGVHSSPRGDRCWQFG